MSVVTLAGSVDGYTARVGPDGRLAVTVLPPVSLVEQYSPIAAGGMSGQVVAEQSGRTQLVIQNLGAFPVHLSFADTSRPATIHDLMVSPGGTFETPCCARYEGAVQAFGAGGASQLAVVEYYTE
jgi:hypothetical protein